MWNLTYFGSFGLDVDDGNSQVSGDATTQWEWNIRHRTNIAVGNCEGSSSHRRLSEEMLQVVRLNVRSVSRFSEMEEISAMPD
ncbi:unnamed protein product [Dracunculus medinensis]|uniref:Uncharacterized protein n=1 Tax=Dracunculus medinensis TaxID=318479 RepID=A0A0N4UE57_DRAME|nr:unnamed protein product [Dracunculus medinensis]